VATQDAVAAVAKDLETKTDINAEAKERDGTSRALVLWSARSLLRL